MTLRPLTLIAIIALLSADPFTARADDPEARRIMQAVEDRDDATQDMEMILIDKNGNQRIRKIRSFGKDKGEDSVSLMFFLSPADVKERARRRYGECPDACVN